MLLGRLLRTLLVAALVMMTGAASARAQATVDPTLMEVRLGQAASLALRGERDGDRLWLPVAELASGMELEIVSRAASRVVLRRYPSRDLLVFDRDSAVVRVGLLPVATPKGALRTSDGELLVDTKVLSTVLRTAFEISWQELVLAVPVIDSLPLGRRIARERARARLLARDEGGGASSIAPLARPLADGAVLDYTLSAPLIGAQRSIGWSGALGLDVLGGSLEVSTGAVAGGARLPTLSSWTGVWREGRKVSQVRLGDGLGSGPLPRLGRGLMITNSPYMRPALFGLQTLRGDLPPGWTIEAYRNGELVAVDTVGRGTGYQLQLPVLYGENPVDLLAVGPFGQTRALSQNVRIGGDLLARNRSEYGVSVAQCRLRQQCVAAGTIDFRVGLTDRWTMRVGLDGVARDTAGFRQAPYFSFSGVPFSTVAVQLDAAAQSRTRLAVNLDPSQRLRLSMEQTWFSQDPIDPLIASRRLSQSSLYAYWRTFDARQTALEASFDRSAFITGGELTRARLSYGTQMAGLRLQPYLRHEQSARSGSGQTALGFETTVLPDGARGRYLGASLLRLLGEVDTRGRAVRQAMTLSMPLPGQFRMDAGVARQFGVRGAMATLTLSRDLNAMRSYTNATMSAGASTATQNLQGSALLARGARRPHFVTGPSLQRTGVTGIVFLDRNANGVRDRGEPAIENAHVQVGTGWARSDADGRYRVWDLAPFVPMPVSVDSTTLPSPLWIPVIAHPNIEAGPNRFEPLDIPVVAGGVVEGRVSWPRPGATSLPPIPVLLRDAQGRVVARTTTFSDGEFVVMAVRPGTLTAHIDPAWLVAQQLRSTAPSPIVLPASDEGATVRVPTITIVAPDSIQQCVPRAGAQCGGVDDDLRERGREQRISVTEAHLETQDLRTVGVLERQQQVTSAAVAGVGQLASRNANQAAITALPVDRQRAGATALKTDAEERTGSGARNAAERERLTDDGRRREHAGLLAAREAGPEGARRDEHTRQAELVERTEHTTQSRQAVGSTRATRLRAHSGQPTRLFTNGKAESGTTEVATSTVTGVVTIASAAAEARTLAATASSAPSLPTLRAAGPVVASGSMRMTAGGALAIDTQGAVPQRFTPAASPRAADSLYLRPMLRPARPASAAVAIAPTVRESTVAGPAFSSARAVPAAPRTPERARVVSARPDAVSKPHVTMVPVAAHPAAIAMAPERARLVASISARPALTRPADRVLPAAAPAVASIGILKVASGHVAHVVRTAPQPPSVRWRNSLNLPEIRAAALSSAVHRPPPDSVPIDDERRTTALSRSELEPARRRRTGKSR